MKIGKILLWGAGISTAIWAAKKFLFKPAVNPATGQGIPPRTTTSGVRDTTANFAGKKAQDYVSTAFNGEFPEDGLNEGFDMATGGRSYGSSFGSSISETSKTKVIVIKRSQNGTPIKWKDANGNIYVAKTTPTKKSQSGKVIEWKDEKGNTWHS